jgi:alkylation response protein AidB-like acyl-CoA dehydrogenase
MDFTFTEREELLRKTVREFAEKEIAPRVPEMEETGQFPSDLVPLMSNIGLLGIIADQEYGGSGLGLMARTIAVEEVSRISGAIGISLQVHHMCIAALQEFGTEDQKKRFIPPLAKDTIGTWASTEQSGGSDLVGMQATAKLDGDVYVLNGRKCFITNANIAGIIGVNIKTGEGSKGISGFVLDKDTPGFKAGREEDKFGLRGANTGELIFQDCRVPRDGLLGEEGQGLRIGLKVINEYGRPGMAATALGILTAVMEAAVKYANERILYGKPLANLQAIQWMIADILTDLETARLLCYRASWLKDQGQPCNTETSMAKMFACEAAARSAKKAIEIHGGYGTMREYPVQRLLRDAMVTIPSGGTAEIAKIVISRAALSGKF